MPMNDRQRVQLAGRIARLKASRKITLEDVAYVVGLSVRQVSMELTGYRRVEGRLETIRDAVAELEADISEAPDPRIGPAPHTPNRRSPSDEVPEGPPRYEEDEENETQS